MPMPEIKVEHGDMEDHSTFCENDLSHKRRRCDRQHDRRKGRKKNRQENENESLATGNVEIKCPVKWEYSQNAGVGQPFAVIEESNGVRKNIKQEKRKEEILNINISVSSLSSSLCAHPGSSKNNHKKRKQRSMEHIHMKEEIDEDQHVIDEDQHVIQMQREHKEKCHCEDRDVSISDTVSSLSSPQSSFPEPSRKRKSKRLKECPLGYSVEENDPNPTQIHRKHRKEKRHRKVEDGPNSNIDSTCPLSSPQGSSSETSKKKKHKKRKESPSGCIDEEIDSSHVPTDRKRRKGKEHYEVEKASVSDSGVLLSSPCSPQHSNQGSRTDMTEHRRRGEGNGKEMDSEQSPIHKRLRVRKPHSYHPGVGNVPVSPAESTSTQRNSRGTGTKIKDKKSKKHWKKTSEDDTENVQTSVHKIHKQKRQSDADVSISGSYSILSSPQRNSHGGTKIENKKRKKHQKKTLVDDTENVQNSVRKKQKRCSDVDNVPISQSAPDTSLKKRHKKRKRSYRKPSDMLEGDIDNVVHDSPLCDMSLQNRRLERKRIQRKAHDTRLANQRDDMHLCNAEVADAREVTLNNLENVNSIEDGKKRRRTNNAHDFTSDSNLPGQVTTDMTDGVAMEARSSRKNIPLQVKKTDLFVSEEVDAIIHPINVVYGNLTQRKLHQQALKDRGIQVRKGMWKKEEDDKLTENWNTMLKDHPLDEPYNLLKHVRSKETANEELKQYVKQTRFYQTLACGLNRTMYSCYCRARRLFHDKTKGSYTNKEFATLMRLRRQYGNKWELIGQKMDRTGKSLQDMYRWRAGKQATGKWSQEEQEQLVQAIREVMHSEDTQNLYHLVPWQQISLKVPSRTAPQCRLHWLQKLSWLVNNDGKRIRWNDHDKQQLAGSVYMLDVSEESEIDWDDLYTQFGNEVSPQYLQKRWFDLRTSVPTSHSKSFEDIREYLFNKWVLGRTK